MSDSTNQPLASKDDSTAGANLECTCCAQGERQPLVPATQHGANVFMCPVSTSLFSYDGASGNLSPFTPSASAPDAGQEIAEKEDDFMPSGTSQQQASRINPNTDRFA